MNRELVLSIDETLSLFISLRRSLCLIEWLNVNVNTRALSSYSIEAAHLNMHKWNALFINYKSIWMEIVWCVALHCIAFMGYIVRYQSNGGLRVSNDGNWQDQCIWLIHHINRDYNPPKNNSQHQVFR